MDDDISPPGEFKLPPLPPPELPPPTDDPPMDVDDAEIGDPDEPIVRMDYGTPPGELPPHRQKRDLEVPANNG